MAENGLAIDTTTLSNLVRSELFSEASIGLDARFAPDQRFVITPEIYYEAVIRNANTEMAGAIQSWLQYRYNSIVNYGLLTSFDPTGTTDFKDLGDRSILQWIEANKANYSVQIISDDAFFRRAELSAGGQIDGTQGRTINTFQFVHEYTGNGIAPDQAYAIEQGWFNYGDQLAADYPNNPQPANGWWKLLDTFANAKWPEEAQYASSRLGLRNSNDQSDLVVYCLRILVRSGFSS